MGLAPMTPDPDRVASIFMAAADLTGEDRRRYLAEACRGEAEVLREVEALLAHDHELSSAFLEGSREQHPANGIAETPPVIGHYECQRPLGRGGQAVVWLAQDVRLGRLVALK